MVGCNFGIMAVYVEIKKGDPQQVASQRNRTNRSAAAGAFGSATGTAGAEVNAAIQFEAVHMKIHLNRFGFFQKFLVNDEFEPINVKGLIRIGRLIQSHG
jgi:hypothetical protein